MLSGGKKIHDSIRVFEPVRQKLSVQRDKNGYEYVEIDSLTSKFYRVARACRFALVSETSEVLVQEGYIIPFSSDIWNLDETMTELEIRSIERLALDHSQVPLPNLPEVIPAIRIQIEAKIEAGDFLKGGRFALSWGGLKTESIKSWTNWRYLGEPWMHNLWKNTGFDPQRLDDFRYRLLAARSSSVFIKKRRLYGCKRA